MKITPGDDRIGSRDRVLDGVLGAEDEPDTGEGLGGVGRDQGLAFGIDVEVEELDGQPELVVGP